MFLNQCAAFKGIVLNRAGENVGKPLELLHYTVTPRSQSGHPLLVPDSGRCPLPAPTSSCPRSSYAACCQADVSKMPFVTSSSLSSLTGSSVCSFESSLSFLPPQATAPQNTRLGQNHSSLGGAPAWHPCHSAGVRVCCFLTPKTTFPPGPPSRAWPSLRALLSFSRWWRLSSLSFV